MRDKEERDRGEEIEEVTEADHLGVVVCGESVGSHVAVSSSRLLRVSDGLGCYPRGWG